MKKRKEAKIIKCCMALTALSMSFMMPVYAAETQPLAAVSAPVADTAESDDFQISADKIHFSVPEQVDNVNEFYVTGYIEDFDVPPGSWIFITADNKVTGEQYGVYRTSGEFTYVVDNQFTFGSVLILDPWDDGEYAVKVYILDSEYNTLGISDEQDITYVKAK